MKEGYKVNLLKRALTIRKKADQQNDLTELRNSVNQLVTLHTEAKNAIKELEKAKNRAGVFVIGPDFKKQA